MITGARDINGNPIPTYSELSKLMADRDGHGMREKCDQHAQVAIEYFNNKQLSNEDLDRIESSLLDRIEFVACIRKKYSSKNLFYIAAQKELEALQELRTKIIDLMI